MKQIAKLLLGVRASKDTIITVNVDEGVVLLPLLQIYSEHKPVSAVEASGRAWTVRLSAGDHVLLLPSGASEPFDRKLSFVVDREVMTFLAGDSPAQFPGGTSEVGIAGDPKNPWPPPIQSRMYMSTEAPWLAETLWRISQEVELTRSFG